MKLFKSGKKWSTILVAVWLIAWGLLAFFPSPFPRSEQVLAVLAIVAGILIFMDR
jgi:CHASE2 domain-containing sensor protein